MKMRITFNSLVVVVLLLGWCGNGRAATITASALTPAAVQTAINSAVDGDTVALPSGSATWTSTVMVTGKGIKIAGAGIGATTITVGSGVLSGQAFEIHNLNAKRFDMSAISFIGNLNGPAISVGGNLESASNFRLHHMHFTINKRGISVQGHNDGGLIDHCTFRCAIDASCQGVTVFGDSGYLLVPGNTSASFPAGTAWTKTATFGDSAKLFIEDCTFNFDYSNDAGVEGYQGSIVCIRNNTFIETMIGMHGLDSTVTGAHSYEIYNNTFISHYYLDRGPGGIGSNGDFIVGIRSGTGVIHDNRFTVDWAATYTFGKFIRLQCYRAVGDNTPYNFALRGTHSGTNNAIRLSVSGTPWSVNQFVIAGRPDEPYTIWNRTDRSIGQIIANTANTITAVLTGGARNNWNTGDAFSIAALEAGMLTGINPNDGNSPVANGSGTHNGGANASVLTDSSKNWRVNEFVSPIQHTIWNRTDGSYGRITTNTATTITARMIGGADNDFDVGDSYVITYGYPGLEQVGSTGPVTLNATFSTQTLSPLYQWNNVLNGSTTDTPSTGLFVCDVGPPDDAGLARQGQIRPYPSDIIVKGRDYYDNVVKPGYTPYVYPHPLQNTLLASPTNLRITP